MLRSAGMRFLIVGLLVILMSVPMFLIGELIGERADYSRQTERELGAEWGGSQTIFGPQLVIPVEGPHTVVEEQQRVDPVTRRVTVEAVQQTEIVRKAPIYVLPDTFDFGAVTESSVRSRGIFEVPVYFAQIDAQFDFDLDDLEDHLGEGETILWEEARVEIGLGSNRGLRGETALTAEGRSLSLEPRGGSGNRAGIRGCFPRQLRWRSPVRASKR